MISFKIGQTMLAIAMIVLVGMLVIGIISMFFENATEATIFVLALLWVVTGMYLTR